MPNGIAIGLDSGHIVTKRAKRSRPSDRRGKLGERVKLVRGIINEVAGTAPYERRIMEILKGRRQQSN